MTRLSRPAGLVMIALAAVTTTGCTFTTQQTTELYYEPADGSEALLGPDVVVSNMIIAAESEDGPGNLVARVVNDGIEPATVLLASPEAGVDLSVTVEPGEILAIGPEGDEEVVLEPVGARPGTLLPMVVALEGGEIAADVLVPVFDDTFPRYATLLPTAEPGGAP